MLKELKKLRDVGAQKIYEDTHISLKYVQSIIRENFEGLTKVQFLGFVSILEREYSKKLPELREKGLAFFDEEKVEKKIESTVFGVNEPKKNFTSLYVVIVLLIFAAAVYYSFGITQEKSPQKNIDNSAIESAKKNIELDKNNTDDGNNSLEKILVIEKNIIATKESNESSVETNTTKIAKLVPKKVIVVKKVQKNQPLIIHTRARLWVGYINKTDNIKKQTVIKNKLILDSSKTWLLSLGHGHLSLEVNAKKKRYNQSKNMFFIYKNGELKQLSKKEFRKLNRGRLW